MKRKRVTDKEARNLCQDPELHEYRPCDCPGVERFISDKERMDWLEENSLAGFVIHGRKALHKSTVNGCATVRQAIDSAIRSAIKAQGGGK